MLLITVIHIIAIAINLILAIFVVSQNRKNATNIIFALLNITIAFWTLSNIETSVAATQDLQLLWVRMVMFSAVILSALFYLFIKFFPSEKFKLNLWEKIFFIIVVPASAITTLTPIVFSSVTKSPGELIPSPVVEPGIVIFAVTVLICIGFGIIFLARRYASSKGELKQQMRLLLYGVGLMFALILAFDFLAVVVFNVTFFISLSPIYTMVFLILATYAIVKYHLFNLKVIATEALITGISITLFSQFLTDQNQSQRVLEALILISTIFLGYLLTRSVRREIEQREQLETLTNKLQAVNKQLKILDQARAEFITIASHQLRTPPATIKWYLAAILDGDYGKFDDTVKEELRKTASTNNSMIALIDDLLNASRIERGKMEFIFQPTDLIEITQITVDQLLPQAEMKKLSLVFQKPAQPLPIIAADKEKLRQVINNLIDNAIKYSQKGTIEVTLSQTKKDLMVKVTDSGRGVTPEQLKGIFQKYDRGKSAPRNSSGLGLGLYVAKVIIEQHKGKIWVESAGEGKGSSFIFTIPVKAQLDNSVFDLTKTEEAISPK